MSYKFAGCYSGQAISALTGRPLPTTAYSVYTTSALSTLATLYTSRTKAVTTTNPNVSDPYGNVVFFSDPGDYWLSINSVAVQVIVQADWGDAGPMEGLFRSGAYQFPYGLPANDGTDADGKNSLVLTPFPVGCETTFDRIGTYLATAQANTNVRVGLYDSVGGVPYNLLVESDSLDTTAGGGTIKETTISLTVPAGFYWIACVWQGTGATMPSITLIETSNMRGLSRRGIAAANIANWGNLNRYWAATNVTGALPNPWVSTSNGNSSPIRTGILRVA